MKKILTLTIVLIMVLAYSCVDDKPTIDNSLKTSFDIGDVHYTSTRTTSYQTDFGQLLRIDGENFEMVIVLSDIDNKVFSITDTLHGSDSGKARCIFKLNSDFKFSTTGTVVYDLDKKSGAFTLNMEGLNLTNGDIKVDTAIYNSIVDFTGITARDIQGFPVNAGDINDWAVRTDWDVVERLVFNLKTQATLSGNIQLVEYPNPFIGSFILNLDIPSESKIDLYLVNTNFEIEQKILGLQHGNAALLLNNSEYKENYYRLFYRIYTDSQQFYGSGDVKAQE